MLASLGLGLMIILVLAWLFLTFNPQFGGKVTAERAKAYDRSSAWHKGKFHNLERTTMDFSLSGIPKMLRDYHTDKDLREPKKPIPVQPLDKETLLNGDGRPKFVWFGHSVLLLQMDGVNLLVDPMLGSNASPIAPFATKRFSENTLSIIDELPPIDAVLMTHDHYDHLDYDSFKKLMPKVDTYLVGLGIGRHLERWNIPTDQITEFDWWQQLDFKGIQITYTPSRHFTGRGPFDRATSLWGGWAFKSATHNIYTTGDGGYGEHFKEIGERLGPFDFAFTESGQYNPNWHQIHMYPEESVWAAQDTNSKVAMPIHWAGFSLAMHPWTEPVDRYVAEAKEKGQAYITPEIGQVVELDNLSETGEWWKSHS